MTRKVRIRRKTWRRIRACILIAAVCLLLISLWQAIGKDLLNAWRARQTQDDARALYYSSAASLFDAFFPTAQAEENSAQTETPPEISEDFQALYDANSHVIGWLKAGADIDYPVVQYDNSYYLNHDFYGREDVNGTLFLNEFNSLLPRDDVLLIHGHNMKSGAMFGNLMDYEDFDYVCEYPIITFRTIYDPQDVCYVPIFAFNASMNVGDDAYFDIARLNFEDDPTTDSQDEVRHSASFSEYLTQMAEKSLWEAPVEVDVSDRLIMLITFSYYQDNGRFILVCRQLRDGETPDGTAELFRTESKN